MPVSPNYTNVFQDMGKLIVIYNDLDEAGPVVETDIVEMVEQLDRNYQNVKILPTIINNAVTARTAMTTGVTNMKAAMDTYLLNALKNDIESTATTASGVLSDLRGLMVDDSETVLFSGVFWTFFDVEYEQDLNSSIFTGVVTIPDSWAE